MSGKAKIEIKHIGGVISETKEEMRNGVPVGLISGYIATWDIDRGDDQLIKGAFLDSIKEHKKRNNRQVRFKDNHGRTVGGFPINTVFEDDKGLFGIAEVNLEVQQGRELFSLAKQKVIVDLSVGFSVVDFQIKEALRLISKAVLWEGSATDEPMNTEANIVDVKTALGIVELEDMSPKELEHYLRDGGKLSKQSCVALASQFVKGRSESGDDEQSESVRELLKELKMYHKIKIKGVSNG